MELRRGFKESELAVIKKIEDEGLLEKQEKGRRKKLSLTEKGEEEAELMEKIASTNKRKAWQKHIHARDS